MLQYNVSMIKESNNIKTDNKIAKHTDNNITVLNLDKDEIRNKIYCFRGQQVMLDFDLAQIYGYSTKTFNQQVKNNIKRFEGEDFMFQLDDSELRILRSNFLTTKISTKTRTSPYAFSEQGIYMLMTVLKGDLAVEQSRVLIRLFKSLKDHVLNNQSLISHNEALAIALNNEKKIKAIKKKLNTMATRKDIEEIHNRLNILNTNFADEDNVKPYIIESNTKFELDEFYKKIFKNVNSSIILIDNYVSSKTLELLLFCKEDISIKIITSKKTNFRDKLKEFEYTDFINEYPNYSISLFDSNNKVHDRFIILDYKTAKQRIFSSGSSIKDAGNKISAIVELKDVSLSKELIDLIENGKEYAW